MLSSLYVHRYHGCSMLLDTMGGPTMISANPTTSRTWTWRYFISLWSCFHFFLDFPLHRTAITLPPT